MCRHYSLLGTTSDISPIHWQYGAIARLQKGEKIDKLLKGGYSTLSLGYIGIYEATKLIKGVSHTTKEGHDFAIKVMRKLRETTDKWKEKTGLGFALYGTPAESLCYKFLQKDKEEFGIIEMVVSNLRIAIKNDCRRLYSIFLKHFLNCFLYSIIKDQYGIYLTDVNTLVN